VIGALLSRVYAPRTGDAASSSGLGPSPVGAARAPRERVILARRARAKARTMPLVDRMIAHHRESWRISCNEIALRYCVRFFALLYSRSDTNAREHEGSA
jgi:hypothetical protein